ncbi:Abi-alpha family protein [Sideroxydans sp.]
MANKEDQSVDVFGLKPVSNSIEKITDGVVDAARAFLGRICLPASEEFGLLLQDHVKAWRASRATLLAKKAEEKVKLHYGDAPVAVQPRIAHDVFEEGSWIQDEVVHDMWSGLLASACSKEGGDDSNVIFIGILKQLTSLQVRVLRFAIESADKYVSRAGWPYAEKILCPIDDVKAVCGTSDVIRIDRELDHLRSLDLISGGFAPDSSDADLTPSPLALNLYVRAEGFPGTPVEYWELKCKFVPNNSDMSDMRAASQ